MPKQIRTPEPNTELCYQGENYESDEAGLVTLPDAAADHFIESMGCSDPAKAHPYGLQVNALGKGKFEVRDENGNKIHTGSLDSNGAFSLARSYRPDEDGDADEDDGKQPEAKTQTPPKKDAWSEAKKNAGKK